MKKLHTFKIAVPVLQVGTKVTHVTPRKPTVLERLVLDLGQNIGQLQDYQSMSLTTIFTEILNIPNAEELMRPAFDNLSNLQILEGYFDDLNTLALSDIQLSEHSNVRYFIENDQLPAQPKSNMIKVEYHGLLRTLVSKISAQSRDHHSIPTLSDNLIGNLYPRELIKDSLKPNKYSWLRATSEIVDLVEIENERKILYVDLQSELIFNGQNLVLASPDEKLNSLFSELSSDDYHTLIKQVVAQYNGQAIDAEEWMGDNPLLSNEAVDFINKQTEIKPLHSVINSVPKLHNDSQMLLHLAVDQLELALPKIQTALTITCSGDETSLYWEDGRAYLALSDFDLPLGVQWLEGSLINKKLNQQKIADVQLQDKNGELHSLRILGESELQSNNPLLEGLLKRLKSLGSEQIDSESWQRLRIFWEPASELWQEWLADPAKPTMRERLKVLQERYLLLGQLGKSTPGQLLPDLLGWLRNQLQIDLPLSKDRLKLAAELCQLINPHDKQLNQEYFEWLQINSQLPESYKQLAEYERLIAFFGKIQPNSCWLHPRLLSDWQNDCGSGNYSKVLDYLPIANAFNSLHQVLIDLKAIFSDDWSRFMGDEQSVAVLARDLHLSPKHKEYRQKLRQYQRSYDKQIEQLTTYSLRMNDTNSSTLVIQVNQAVECYLYQLSQPDFLLEAASKIFVVDSCFLIKQPALPKQLKQGEVMLVPAKVHEELDNLKAKRKNKHVSAGAGKAIKAIEDKDRGNVITIEADLALLPSGYDCNKADNYILSSVLSYKKYDPIFLTDDKNLANKAKGLEIPTLSVAEYISGAEASTELSKAIKNSGSEPEIKIKETLL